jgi:hypothetical protein
MAWSGVAASLSCAVLYVEQEVCSPNYAENNSRGGTPLLKLNVELGS